MVIQFKRWFSDTLTRSFRLTICLSFFLLLGFVQQVYSVPLKITDNIRAVWSDKSGLDGEFTFVVIGDTRDNDKVFLSLLDRLKSFDPLFVVNVGDLVNRGTTKQYDHYAQTLADFDVPLLNVPGNHDIMSGKSVYQQYIGNLNWFFDYGSYRFVALDNASGAFTDDAVEFARKYITNDKTCFVFFHCPPPYDRWKVHSMGGTMKTPRTAEIMSIIESAKPSVVFVGHIHLYDEMTIGSVPFVVCGGGGAELNKGYHIGTPEHGFTVVHVSGAGVTHEWVGLTE
jgi:3',5'-cyclic-AMP phosphodiesterase